MKKYEIVDKTPADNSTENTGGNFGVITPEWSLGEIILSEKIRDTLDDAIAFCINKDKIVEEWGLKRFLKGKGGSVGINFFGPPGTGKSIAADAFANEIGMNVIRADYSEITGNLFGDTEKNLTKLFENAENNNALIFFDEADALLSKRHGGTKSSENTNQIKSHLLTLLDRSKVVIVFATNFFENYDKAFFRRILFHVEFEMPNFEQRVQIWKFHLDETIPKSVSYDDLSELTNGIAGGDIKNLALKLCIKLSSKKINSIDIETVRMEVEKYKKSLEVSEGMKLVDKLPDEIINP